MKSPSDKFRLRSARVLVIVFGILAYAMAMSAEGVYALVEEASAFGSSGLFAVIIFGMWSKRGGPATASATLIAGVASYVAFGYVLPQFGYETSFPYLISLAASVVVYVGFMNFERRSANESTPAPAA